MYMNSSLCMKYCEVKKQRCRNILLYLKYEEQSTKSIKKYHTKDKDNEEQQNTKDIVYFI